MANDESSGAAAAPKEKKAARPKGEGGKKKAAAPTGPAPKYKKYLKRRNKVKAHDQQNRCGVGDRVLIAETRPLSRDKRWAVRAVLEKAV